jgi:Phosphopantetheine attachment site
VRNLSLHTQAQTTNKPKTATVEVLTAIWRRVLEQPCVGIDDDFFDLGGDSVLALRLVDEVMQTCYQKAVALDDLPSTDYPRFIDAIRGTLDYVGFAISTIEGWP